MGVLGSLVVRRGDVTVTVGQPKLRCLLGLLAVQPGQVVPPEELVDALWGERPPATCLTLVHTYVARLRGLLEPGRQRRTPAHVVVRLARSIESRYPEAQALVGLAVAHRHAGQPDRAGSYGQVAITLTRRAGFRVLEGQALTAVAAVHLDKGELDLAIRHAGQAVTLHRETGHRLGEARALLLLGHALRQAGDTESAQPCVERARALFQDVGGPDAEVVA